MVVKQSLLYVAQYGIVGLLVCLLCARMNAAFADTLPMTPGLSDVEVSVLGQARHFKLYIPGHVDTARPVPVVMAFHGYRTKPADFIKTTGFNNLADQKGFIAVYPVGEKNGWNGEAASQDITTTQAQADLLFVDAVLDKLLATHKVDSKRVYAVGISSGGFFVQRLACRRSDKFAAFATVASTMGLSLSQDCHPEKPVSMLMIQGVSDPIVTYGGQIKRIHFLFPEVQIMPFPRTVDFWVRQNACDAGVVEKALPSKLSDHTAVTERLWPVCAGQASVRAVTIAGGGHTWPDQPQDSWLQRLLIGRVSHQFNASELIWSFLEVHSL